MDRRPLVETRASLGLSILSWRGAETLEKSLKSYAEQDLFSLFDHCQIFLPDPDKEVIAVAERYPLAIVTKAKNQGILENMAASVEAMPTDLILMLENDCPLIEDRTEAVRQINLVAGRLADSKVIMARLRSVKYPGQAFDGLRKYRKLHRSKLGPLLRPGKAKRLAGYALYDGDVAMQRHAKYFRGNIVLTLVSTEIMPWTNQSILVRRGDMLETILPMARAVKTTRGANRLPNLEIELNNHPGWTRSDWWVACPPGLFTHERIGDRGYD